MQYELVPLEELIEHTIRPDQLFALPKTSLQKKQEEWANFIAREKDRICLQLSNSVFDTTDSLLVERYIQQHQHAINALANTVLSYMEPPKEQGIMRFYTEICSVLESLLSYILKHFYKYFDVNQPLPHSHGLIAREEISHQLQPIEKELAHTGVNPDLLLIALKPVRQFIQTPRPITYRQLDYYKELLYQVSLLQNSEEASYMVLNYQLIADILFEISKSEKNATVRLNILLLYMNFNAPDLIAFCISRFRQKYDAYPDSERLHIMRMYKKFLAQIRSKPGYSLMPEVKDSACDQVRFWFEQEIDFMQINGNKPSPDASPTYTAIPYSRKIPTNLSVAELALLVKTAGEAKIIHEIPPMELLRKMAETYHTAGTEQISINSFKNHYFNPKKTAATSSIRMLQEWIKVLRRYE